MSIEMANLGDFQPIELFNHNRAVFGFEKTWNEQQFDKWIKENWTYSLIYGLIYVVGVFGGRAYMENKPRYDLRLPLVLWNIALALFSFLGAARTWPEMLEVLYKHGFRHSVCIPSYYDNQVISFWCFMFVTSKVYELGDTIFVVLRKQNLMFLHWYHHITVMVYVWYSYTERNAPGRWFYTMNYLVHTFMYTYYALRALRFRVPRIFAMSITLMQISQMAVGVLVGIYAYYVKNILHGYCGCSDQLLYATYLMYGSYFVLFVQFFVNAYMEPKRKAESNNNVAQSAKKSQ